MISLVPKERRESELLKFGAPPQFVKNIGEIDELKFSVENVDGAYFYLPTISNYKILKDLSIIPIYDCGESFYVFGYGNEIKKIFHFELEHDEVYDDYGTNWQLLLFNTMFNYFEIAIDDDDFSVKQFKSVGEKLGFDKSESLYKKLDIPLSYYNLKYQELDNWKLEIAQQLNIL